MITEFQDGFITKTKLNELVGGINDIDSNILTADITKTVGSGGDFLTLNLAINWCKKLTPNGYKVTISIIGGTIIQESLIFKNVDLRFVEIISSDSSVVTVDGNYLTPNYILTFAPFIYSENSVFPKISFKSILINEPLTSNGIYIYSEIKSEIHLNDNVSISGFPFGIRVMAGSTLIANSIDILDGLQGILAFNSRVDALYSNISSTSLGVYSAQMSHINAVGCNCPNAESGFQVGDGGFISCRNSTGTLYQTANTITSNGIIFK